MRRPHACSPSDPARVPRPAAREPDPGKSPPPNDLLRSKIVYLSHILLNLRSFAHLDDKILSKYEQKQPPLLRPRPVACSSQMVATARLLLAAALPAASAFALLPSPSLALRPPAASALMPHASHLGAESSRRMIPGPRPSSRLPLLLPRADRGVIGAVTFFRGTVVPSTRSCRSSLSLPPPPSNNRVINPRTSPYTGSG
jgi:hypothetical protein